jgi:hypothetical protein
VQSLNINVFHFPEPDLSFTQVYSTVLHILGGRDRSVGIATGYGLDGPWIEYRPALVPTQPPVQWVPGFLRG